MYTDSMNYELLDGDIVLIIYGASQRLNVRYTFKIINDIAMLINEDEYIKEYNFNDIKNTENICVINNNISNRNKIY